MIDVAEASVLGLGLGLHRCGSSRSRRIHAAWRWERTIGERARLGHEAVAVDLPGHGARVEDPLTAWTIPERRDAIVGCPPRRRPGPRMHLRGRVRRPPSPPRRRRRQGRPHVVVLAAVLPREGTGPGIPRRWRCATVEDGALRRRCRRDAGLRCRRRIDDLRRLRGRGGGTYHDCDSGPRAGLRPAGLEKFGAVNDTPGLGAAVLGGRPPASFIRCTQGSLDAAGAGSHGRRTARRGPPPSTHRIHRFAEQGPAELADTHPGPGHHHDAVCAACNQVPARRAPGEIQRPTERAGLGARNLRRGSAAPRRRRHSPMPTRALHPGARLRSVSVRPFGQFPQPNRVVGHPGGWTSRQRRLPSRNTPRMQPRIIVGPACDPTSSQPRSGRRTTPAGRAPVVVDVPAQPGKARPQHDDPVQRGRGHHQRHGRPALIASCVPAAPRAAGELRPRPTSLVETPVLPRWTSVAVDGERRSSGRTTLEGTPIMAPGIRELHDGTVAWVTGVAALIVRVGPPTSRRSVMNQGPGRSPPRRAGTHRRQAGRRRPPEDSSHGQRPTWRRSQRARTERTRHGCPILLCRVDLRATGLHVCNCHPRPTCTRRPDVLGDRLCGSGFTGFRAPWPVDVWLPRQEDARFSASEGIPMPRAD